jgi:nicotinate-nucleotide adenylyltransferase
MGDRSGQAARRIGVLGGTFDPVHLGHLVAASEALHRFSLERVILVPAGRPWQKASFSDPEDRFMMATLAAATHPKLAVSRIELDRPGPTYTVETLETMHGFFGDAELFFIAGADAILELGTWHRIADLASMTDIIAVTRPGSDIRNLVALDGWPVIHSLEIPGIDISSTDIRRRVAEGLPIDHLVPAAVHRFIAERGLYVGIEEARGA